MKEYYYNSGSGGDVYIFDYPVWGYTKLDDVRSVILYDIESLFIVRDVMMTFDSVVKLDIDHIICSIYDDRVVCSADWASEYCTYLPATLYVVDYDVERLRKMICSCGLAPYLRERYVSKSSK